LFVRLRGETYVLWRAVDEHGPKLDILLQKRRDTAAAERFFSAATSFRPTLNEAQIISRM
jgi:putative transposase